MTDQAERYDRIAAGYARWWAPVLTPAVEELLDRAGSLVEAGASRLIDIGTGTGQLALGAVARWPDVSVVAIDASAGMRAMADANAEQQLAAQDRSRFRTEVADADALPFRDSSFDLALSSFVFQLVPNRARALREARRVLRPGGSLAYVSWLRDDRPFQPDLIFDEVLEALGIGARENEGPSGDLHLGRAGGRRASTRRVHGRRCGSRPPRAPVHRARLHRLPVGVRRGDPVRGAGPRPAGAPAVGVAQATRKTPARADDHALSDRVRGGPPVPGTPAVPADRQPRGDRRRIRPRWLRRPRRRLPLPFPRRHPRPRPLRPRRQRPAPPRRAAAGPWR